MFSRESNAERKLKIELANQRRINAELRRQLPQASTTRRILDQALQDAIKLIDMAMAREPITRDAVRGMISRRRFSYATALLKAANIVHGGGRGEPYRWRRMSYDEMMARVRGAHERLCDNVSMALEHVPDHIRNRVRSLSPTGHR